MKKILVIALALASVNAFGSRARMTALGNAEHLIDTQTTYINPSDMFYVGGDFVNVESGVTTAGDKGTNAEGLVVRSMGDAKLGLSLGHRSDNASSYQLGGLPVGLRKGITFTGLGNANQQNPLELTYGMKAGDMAYAATLVYSNYNNKTANEKETSGGLRLGMRMGAIDAAVGLGLINTAETATIKYKGTLGVTAEAGYTMDSMYMFGKVLAAGFKRELSGTETAKEDTTDIQLGVLSTVKKDGSEFFYGAKIVSTTVKDSVPDNKTTLLNIPIIMGLEVDANSWLTLRGSLTQKLVLLDNTKVETPSTPATNLETSPGANSTTAAFGAGLKFNKLTLDGTILAGGIQTYSSANLLGQVGLTYMF